MSLLPKRVRKPYFWCPQKVDFMFALEKKENGWKMDADESSEDTKKSV